MSGGLGNGFFELGTRSLKSVLRLFEILGVPEISSSKSSQTSIREASTVGDMFFRGLPPDIKTSQKLISDP